VRLRRRRPEISAGESPSCISPPPPPRVNTPWTDPGAYTAWDAGSPPRAHACGRCRATRSIALLCRSVHRHAQYPSPPPDYWLEKRIGGGRQWGSLMVSTLPSTSPSHQDEEFDPLPPAPVPRPTSAVELEVLQKPSAREHRRLPWHGERAASFQLISGNVDGKNAREWVMRSPKVYISAPRAHRVAASLSASRTSA